MCRAHVLPDMAGKQMWSISGLSLLFRTKAPASCLLAIAGKVVVAGTAGKGSVGRWGHRGWLVLR